jgi:hypothetical protein
VGVPVVSEFQLGFLAFFKVLAFAAGAFLLKHRTLKIFTAKIGKKNCLPVQLFCSLSEFERRLQYICQGISLQNLDGPYRNYSLIRTPNLKG